MRKNLSLAIAVVSMAIIFSGCSNPDTGNQANNLATKPVSGSSGNGDGSNNGKGIGGNQSKKKIGMVLKILGTEHWLTVKKGAEKAAEEEDVDIAVFAPDKESNVEQQFKIIEDLIQQRVDALIIAPCDTEGVKPFIKAANKVNIPVFTVDTNTDANIVSFAGTDNILGGKIAGDRIIQILNGKGKVALITGVIGNQTHRDRKEGFKKALRKAPGIELVAEQHANSEFTLAVSVMKNILQLNPDMDAVFCTSALMSLGAAEAIDAAGKTGIVKIVGFDTETDALNAILAGKIDSMVAQNPYNMGYQIIKNAVKYLKGEQVPKVTDTGTELITKENVDKYR